MCKHNEKVVVGLSGGVDSSVSALLLKNQGFKVIGVFMKNWEEDSHCAAERDIRDCEHVCQKIGVEFKKINFSSEYWDYVFQSFLEDFKKGKTPNPDILCNKVIKFKIFLDYAKSLNSTNIATGHYARTKMLPNGEYQLLKGVDKDKDQSYFLYTLSQAKLKHTIFPLGNLKKSEVRTIAQKNNLITHNKKDSTGICFIGNRRFKPFLSQYLLTNPGKIQDENGTDIGSHDGLMYYTIGQRKGLHIGGIKGQLQSPWFVARKDIKNNAIIAVQGNSHPLLFNKSLVAGDLNWIKGKAPDNKFLCTAKIRYRQFSQRCQVSIRHKKAFVVFDCFQRAITPGQSIVFYKDEICLGGGIIQ